MYQFLEYYNIPVIVVATKANKIPRGRWSKYESEIKKVLDFDHNDAFILFSSVTRQGKERAQAAIEQAIES